MDFEFCLDEKYVAFYVLNRRMHDEGNDIKIIKEKLLSSNSLGYRKILNVELLDISVYLRDSDIYNLLLEFVSTDEFTNVYKFYESESKEKVAINILSNKIASKDNSLTNIKNYLWHKHRDGYIKIRDNFSGFVDRYLEDKDVNTVIGNFISTDEFKEIFLETQRYMELVNEEWKSNKLKINKYLSRIIKKDFTLKPKVFIVHPNSCKGYNFDRDKIIWGHFQGLEEANYNLTYLVHEGLHCLLPYSIASYPNSENVIHSIIELSSDYELYSMLKGKSTLNEGHVFLKPLKEFLYPFWLEYIGLTSEEKSERMRKDNVVCSTINNEEIRNMNIIEFINYSCKEYEQNYQFAEKRIR